MMMRITVRHIHEGTEGHPLHLSQLRLHSIVDTFGTVWALPPKICICNILDALLLVPTDDVLEDRRLDENCVHQRRCMPIFHVDVCLFSNRSQSGRQNVIRASDTQMRLVCHFFFLTTFWRPVCDPLTKRPTATWNLFACTVVGSCCTRIWAKQDLNRAKKLRNVKRR